MKLRQCLFLIFIFMAVPGTIFSDDGNSFSKITREILTTHKKEWLLRMRMWNREILSARHRETIPGYWLKIRFDDKRFVTVYLAKLVKFSPSFSELHHGDLKVLKFDIIRGMYRVQGGTVIINLYKETFNFNIGSEANISNTNVLNAINLLAADDWVLEGTLIGRGFDGSYDPCWPDYLIYSLKSGTVKKFGQDEVVGSFELD